MPTSSPSTAPSTWFRRGRGETGTSSAIAGATMSTAPSRPTAFAIVLTISDVSAARVARSAVDLLRSRRASQGIERD